MKKLLLASIITSALMGCGGGNSESTTNNTATNNSGVTAPPPTPFSFTLAADAQSIQEGSQVNLTVTPTVSGAEYAVEASSDLVTSSIDGNSIALSFGDFDKDMTVLVKVTGKSGDTTQSEEVSISVENTSAIQLIADVQRLQSAKGSADKFEEAGILHALYTDLAKKSGVVSYSDAQSMTVSFASSALVSGDAIVSAIDKSIASLTEYQSGGVSDSGLIESKDMLLETMASESEKVLALLNATSQNLNAGIPEIESDGFVYDEASNTFSMFFGNKHLGEYVDGSWFFNTSNEYMSKVLPGPFGAQVCLVEVNQGV